jgi:ATP-binding cassette subfamily B protein
VATIFALSLGASLALAAREVARGTMSVGDFVLVNAYVLQIARPLELLGVAARSLSQGIAYLQRMLELFRERPEPSQISASPTPADAGGELVFDELTFSYRPGRKILDAVSFRVPAGKTVAIVGASGSGKSSLVRLLFRLYEPDAGRVLLDGGPIAAMPFEALRQAIAVVPQDTVLFNDTIGRNIAFGRPGCTAEEIERAARLAHLHELIASLPERYDTPVGERGLKLSGGEKQRVAIARAALKRPRIYVFDEATSSLDTRTEREILANLIDLSRLATTLIIAHRLSTVVHADEILVLHRGAIVERGAHAELLELEGAYAAMWRAQQAGHADRRALA